MYFPKAEASYLARSLANMPPDHLGLLLVAEGEADRLQEMQAALAATGQPFLGGLFPRVLVQGEQLEHGAILLSLRATARPSLIQGLDSERPDLSAIDLGVEGSSTIDPSATDPSATDPSAIDRKAEEQPDQAAPWRTALVLVDGLAPAIGSFLASLFDRFGEGTRFLGGGAGQSSLQPGPCLISNEGVHQNAALVAFLDLEASVAVRHGWQTLSSPLVADDTERNCIRSLNWEQPLQVYSDLVEQDCGRPVTRESFSEISKAYPFGISRSATEAIVRDPIVATEEGYLICVGEVPEHSMLTLLKGEPQDLIAAAAAAGQDVSQTGPSPDVVLVIDCVSRSIYLDARFTEELDAVTKALGSVAQRAWGMLSLGEIAFTAHGQLEFLNKTIVVGALHAPG